MKNKFGNMICECGSHNITVGLNLVAGDWNCEAGEGSGYDTSIEMVCEDCGRVYTIGYLKDYRGFSEPKDNNNIVRSMKLSGRS